jgi:hypothetical protein
MGMAFVADRHEVLPYKGKLWILLGVLDVMHFRCPCPSSDAICITDHTGLTVRVIPKLHRTQLVTPSVGVVDA